MIRIDAVWLATDPLDMRAGIDSALARVIKVLVHDGIGFWLAARRLHQGHFVWPTQAPQGQLRLSTAQLDARVLVAKYSDHLPLYRQEHIFGRAGVEIPRSTLAQWVGVCGVRLQPLVDALKAQVFQHAEIHADETPVQMLKPGNKKTHRA